MKLINYMVLMFALTLAATSSAFGQEARKVLAGGPKEGSVTEEITRLELEYDQAFARSNAEALERLHTDDFRMTARGRVMTKAEILAGLKDPNHPRDVIESLTTDDAEVRVYGDAVVTTGHWKRVSKDAAGKDTSAQGFFTRVWVRRNNRWQVAVAHYSPIAPPAKQQ